MNTATIVKTALKRYAFQTLYWGNTDGKEPTKFKYSFDEEHVYRTIDDDVEDKAEITEEQNAQLRSLHFDENIKASYIFRDAFGPDREPERIREDE
jgi:hypothetical protein